MIYTKDNFGYSKDVLLVFLRNGFNFLYKGYQIVLIKKSYSLKVDGSNLENKIRDDIHREAEKLLKKAALEKRDDKFLRFSFKNENRDVEDENDVKRFDLSLSYDSAPYLDDIIIECKRLHKNEKNLKYLENGIERFETNRYGYGLPIGGMIGFIEKGEETKIIDDLTKKLSRRISTEKNLTETASGATIFSEILKGHVFQSCHRRPEHLEKIELYHLFMNFTSIIHD
jgi:hypothetical protein